MSPGALAVYGILIAQTAGVELRWSAPEGCPDEGYVLGEILRLSPEARRGPALAAQATASAGPDGRWQLELATRQGDATGERLVEAASCQEAADAAAIIIALALDQRPPPAVEQPAPPPAPPAQVEAWRFFAGAHLGGNVGALAYASPGLGVGAGIARGGGRLELRGALGLPQRVLRGPRADTGAELQLMGGAALRGCHVALGEVRWAELCAGLEAASMRGQGFGVIEPAAGSALWLSALAGGAVSLPLSETLRLRAEAAAALSLTRPRFVLEDFGEVHQPALLTGAAALGLEVLFR